MDKPPVPIVFDQNQRRRARARALAHHDQDSRFLFDWAGRQLADRLLDIRREFTAPLKIGTRDRTFLPHAPLTMDIGAPADVVAEEDFLPFAAHSFDLVFSALSLHNVNDLPGALIQIRHALKPDGLFLGAMLGGETLHELRHCLQQAEMELSGGLSPRLSPFADKRQMGSLMQRAQFALPVIDSDIVTVTYASLDKLFADLRGMGERNILTARARTIPPRRLFARAQEIYRDLYAERDGRLAASFEVIFLLGWAPHDSQQQPLKPGSAQTRLADALQTQERELPHD